MVTIQISDRAAAKLTRIANERGLSIEALVEQMVDFAYAIYGEDFCADTRMSVAARRARSDFVMQKTREWLARSPSPPCA